MHALQAPAQPIESLAGARETPVTGLRQARGEAGQRAQPLGPIGHDEFGGAGRGRRAHVRGEVGDRHVDFVADARNHRDPRRADRPRDDFLVEGPQVLE